MTRLMMAIIALMLTSCLPSDPQTRSNNLISTEDPSPTPTPNDPNMPFDGATFLQEGSNQTLAALTLPFSFNDSFLIRGSLINEYLLETADAKVCIAIDFSATTLNSRLILFGKKSFFTNFSTGNVEYFIRFEPANGVLNFAECETVGNTFSGSIVYNIADTCTGSCNGNYESTPIQIFRNDTFALNNLGVNSLRLILVPGTTFTGSGLTCSNSATCVAQGFGCCVSGQCVNDGQEKPNASFEPNYNAATNAVGNNPSSYINFPNVFYVCPTFGSGNNNNNSGNNTGEQINQAQQTVDIYGEYLACTDTTEGEEVICSTRINNASETLDNWNTAINTLITLPLGDQTFTYANGILLGDRENLVEVIYNSQVLVEAMPQDHFDLGAANDNMILGQVVALKTQNFYQANPANDILIYRYRMDGSCNKVNANLARCWKKYVQGQESIPKKTTDHPISTFFNLPPWTNTSFPVIVKVDNQNIASSASTWQLNGVNVEFAAAANPTAGQTVLIDYYVTDAATIEALAGDNSPVSIAQNAINSICNCGTSTCSLSPIFETINGVENISGYSCIYDTSNNPTTPLQQTVYVSSKNIPMRFFSNAGTAVDDGNTANFTQEGNTFSYTNNDPLRPNNVLNFIGVNEVYGSINNAADAAKPAKMVSVQRGKTYTIYGNSGSFSPCLTCGTNPYNSLQMIFPNTFNTAAAGYEPVWHESRRSENTSKFRAEDWLFGRACFVPMTMIPWTHIPKDNLAEQRRSRLSAQHFMFANGYKRDWYGFDYGALIGSFDGIKWFAIGNKRRVTATSPKLYLAVNSYFADRNLETIYQVQVHEQTIVDIYSPDVAHDTESDGAQCQSYHICDTDNDCISQLGYEYTCQSVTGIKTPWPQFNLNGDEITSSSQELFLSSIVGGTNGFNKRCVYRGRGSLCTPGNYSIASANMTYAKTSLPGINGCSANTYCQDMNGANADRFNNRITRFARGPQQQNNSSVVSDTLGVVDSDRFGQGARDMGRPFQFNGNIDPDNILLTDYWGQYAGSLADHFTTLNSASMCLPGKPVSIAGDMESLNGNGVAPVGANEQGDRIGNIGVTKNGLAADSEYLSACPTTNNNDLYYSFQANISLADPDFIKRAANQNISSNILALPPFLDNTNLLHDTGIISASSLTPNACLRAPGASCFTDLDCAPSKFIANQAQTLTNANWDFAGFSNNQAEQDFWKEGLTCAQKAPRFLNNLLTPNPGYDVTKNRCCRETGNTISIHSAEYNGIAYANYNPTVIAGVDSTLNEVQRYTRMHTVADVLGNNQHPNLVKPTPGLALVDPPQISLNRQFNTFHKAAARTCCSENWVRKSGDGTDIIFSASTHQSIDKAVFKCLNRSITDNSYDEELGGVPLYGTFEYCSSDPSDICNLREISSPEQNRWLKWFGKLELAGIPQINLQTADNDQYDCIVNPLSIDTNSITTGANIPVGGVGAIISGAATNDLVVSGVTYYNGADFQNDLNSVNVKTNIFSENEVRCCLPAGEPVAATTTPGQCCTGLISNANSNYNRCCLNDYTDVSVYLNRYVSSEGSDADANLIDLETGYLAPEEVKRIADEKNLCCSGKLMQGNAIHPLLNLGQHITNPNVRRRRFVENNDTALGDGSALNSGGSGSPATYYDAGLKWNNHWYCVPSNMPPLGDKNWPNPDDELDL